MITTVSLVISYLIQTHTHKKKRKKIFSCCSVIQSRPTFCNPMDCRTLGSSLFHHLLELHKFRSIESVMPSNYLILCHPLLLLPSVFPSIRGFSSESTRHITWPIIGVSASASVLPVKIQDWYPLGLTCPCSPRDSRVFSNTTVQNHQFCSTQPSLWSKYHIHT